MSEEACSEGFLYPAVRRDETVKDTYDTTLVSDPYRWLESPSADETKEFIEKQNALTVPYLTECKYRKTINDIIVKFWDYPKVSTPFRYGDYLYLYRNTGLQNQSVIYQLKDLDFDAEGRVFLNPNQYTEDGTSALSGTAFSEDGCTFAYGMSRTGSDWIDIRFRDAESTKDYEETLMNVRYSSLTWMHDNKGFFYAGYLDADAHVQGTETDDSVNQKLYYHKLGTSQFDDIPVVSFGPNSLYRIGAKVSHCGGYLVVTPVLGCKNNELYIADLTNEIKEPLELKPIITTLDSDYEYVTNKKNLFYFRTNKNAPNYKVVEIDIDNPSEENWRDLIPEDKADVLDFAKTIDTNKLIICYLQDVKHTLQLYSLENGEKLYDFELEMGSISGISGKHNHKEFFFSFCSFLTPNIIYQVNLNEDGSVSQKVIHETKVGKGVHFDKSKFTTEQVFYPSKDGTKIPMFIVGRKDYLENKENRPCLLYGYGGFNVNLTPSFAVSRLIFMSHFHGYFALANIRGGGEYGNKWHDSGRFENKQNCFDDFQYAAKYLIENNYTSSSKLTIQGGSNGGLLVAACINQAPELFGAAICQVGVLDMLRYDKFTIGYAWRSDFGSVSEKGFDYLYKYSPLHNIFTPTNGKQYPATLLLTADHDDRVVPLHSLKFIAELQHKAGNSKDQKNPLLICIESKAGHGAGKPTSKVIEELTNIFCFISRSLNLPFDVDE